MYQSLFSKIQYFFFNFYSFCLLVYVILLILSSLSFFSTIFINTMIFTYGFSLWLRNRTSKFKNLILVSFVGNFLVFELMVASYAELLVWEHVLHIVFYIIAFYYYFFTKLKRVLYNFKQNGKIYV